MAVSTSCREDQQGIPSPPSAERFCGRVSIQLSLVGRIPSAREILDLRVLVCPYMGRLSALKERLMSRVQIRASFAFSKSSHSSAIRFRPTAATPATLPRLRSPSELSAGCHIETSC